MITITNLIRDYLSVKRVLEFFLISGSFLPAGQTFLIINFISTGLFGDTGEVSANRGKSINQRGRESPRPLDWFIRLFLLEV
jgi:hypothetical protein